MSESLCNKLDMMLKDEASAQSEYMELRDMIEDYGETARMDPDLKVMIRESIEWIRSDEATHADNLEKIRRILKCPL
jgi:rubrerythrin